MTRTLVVLATLAITSVSQAQVPDHLKCYKVKDPSAKAEYTADLGGLAPEPGCLIKTPAKMACVESTKANVTPPPPGAPAGQRAGRFVCYAVKCPKLKLPPLPVVDQFGARELQPSAPKLVCAPVAVPSTTTSTTTSTTLVCGQPGEPCCDGVTCVGGCCATGSCVAESTQCGDPACTDTSGCTYVAPCDETGTKPQSCTPQICSSGACVPGSPFTRSVDCTRTTDGDICAVAAAGCPVGTARSRCCASGACAVLCGPCQQVD